MILSLRKSQVSEISRMDLGQVSEQLAVRKQVYFVLFLSCSVSCGFDSPQNELNLRTYFALPNCSVLQDEVCTDIKYLIDHYNPQAEFKLRLCALIFLHELQDDRFLRNSKAILFILKSFCQKFAESRRKNIFSYFVWLEMSDLRFEPWPHV